MTRIRTRSQFNFDSASRQLDSRDLDNITDPTTDLGGAVADAVAEYASGTNILPAYPGFDIMDGEITGPLSLLRDDFSDLAAQMGRAAGYESYPAVLPDLGTWSAEGVAAITWTPNEPGIYHWYSLIQVDWSQAMSAATQVAFCAPQPKILAWSWGADIVMTERTADDVWRMTHHGVHMASQDMIDAGYGGLTITSPYYNAQSAGTVDSNYLMFAVTAWNPAGTVPYLDGL